MLHSAAGEVEYVRYLALALSDLARHLSEFKLPTPPPLDAPSPANVKKKKQKPRPLRGKNQPPQETADITVVSFISICGQAAV